MNRFSPLLMLLISLSIACIPRGMGYDLPEVYVFGDYGSAASFFLSMGRNDRIVLSENVQSTVRLLKELGFPAGEGRAENKIRGDLTPHDLSYLLLYVKEYGGTIDPLMNRIADISKQLSEKESDVAVLFYSSDGPDYALLAAYVAYLKEARLIDLDTMQLTPDLLNRTRYTILVTLPITSKNYDRYTRIVDTLISVDEDPYLDSALGILTGPEISAPFVMLLSSDAASRGLIGKLRGISLVEDLPLARKVEFIASMYGMDSRVVHPDLGLTNLTMKEATEMLRDARMGVIYLNLHGNPHVMALKTDGDVVLTSSSIRAAEPLGSIVITLSCDTLRLSEVYDASGSVAYAFLESGAFAYIGSTKLEFSIGSEAGTSYPDLVLMMTLTGHSLGEAVRTVNNLRIKEYRERGIDPREAAYEVLLGDPTLSLANGKIPFYIESRNEVFEIKLSKTMPEVYIRIKVIGNIEPSVKTDLPSVYYRWYSDDDGLFIYISTLSSSYSGYFTKGTDILINLRRRYGYLEPIPYLAILLVVILSLLSFIRAGRQAR